MTKTLEELKKEGRQESVGITAWRGMTLPQRNDFYQFLDAHAEKVWNTAIDTAIGNLPNEEERNPINKFDDGYITGYNKSREEALQTLLNIKV